MNVESMTEQFTKLGQQTTENYWKAVEQVSESADRMTDSFLAGVPGMSEEGVAWMKNWRNTSRQGLEQFKQNLNNLTTSAPGFEMPKEASRKAQEAYREQVNRWFEQTAAFQEKGRQAVESFMLQLPEPAKQWMTQWNKTTDQGVATLKSLMLGEFDPAGYASAFGSGPADGSKTAKKTAGKTAGKSRAN